VDVEGTIGRRNAFGQQNDDVIVKSWTRLGVALRHDLVDERIYDQPRNNVVMFRAVRRQIPSQVSGTLPARRRAKSGTQTRGRLIACAAWQGTSPRVGSVR
jgi:hypothetical protein